MLVRAGQSTNWFSWRFKYTGRLTNAVRLDSLADVLLESRERRRRATGSSIVDFGGGAVAWLL